MENKLLNSLEELYNIDIKDAEYKNINYENCLGLFNQVEIFLLDQTINERTLKEKVALKAIQVVRNFSKLEENISSFNETIVKLYDSYIKLMELNILFENEVDIEITNEKMFNELELRYATFIENPNNELFIKLCYSKIEEFNQKVNNYLNREDIYGNKHKDIIKKYNIDLLKEEIDISKDIMKK